MSIYSSLVTEEQTLDSLKMTDRLHANLLFWTFLQSREWQYLMAKDDSLFGKYKYTRVTMAVGT